MSLRNHIRACHPANQDPLPHRISVVSEIEVSDGDRRFGWCYKCGTFRVFSDLRYKVSSTIVGRRLLIRLLSWLTRVHRQTGKPHCPSETTSERVCYKCKQPGHVQAAEAACLVRGNQGHHTSVSARARVPVSSQDGRQCCCRQRACRWATTAIPLAPYVTAIPPRIDHYGCKNVVHGDDITSDGSCVVKIAINS